jgi:hypothetical protein
MDTHDSGWSDQEYEAMLDRVDTVLATFTDSDQFDELTRYQQQEASFVIEGVAELLYGYEDTTIEECDEPSLEMVCTRIYPAKVSVEPDHFGAVAPVVAAFFRFLDERDIHPDGKRLAAHVEGLGDEIVATAADSANWSPATSVATGDRGNPVDMTPDEAAGSRPEPIDGGPEELSPEELAALDDAIDSLSPESRAALETVTEALLDPARPASQDAVFDAVDVTPKQYQDAMDEALANLEESDAIGTPGNDQDPSVLDTDQAERFLELYGRLLVYVNDRFDVVPEIDSYEEFSTAFLDEIQPVRDRLYHESDTEEIILEFVAENPADISEAALSQVEEWVAYEAGRFAVVEHREADTVFLDPEEPRAFGVTAVHEPLSHGFPEQDLPMLVPDVVLLPFEDTVVTDGWLRPDPILLGAWDIIADTDLESLDEEARHRYGIAETLPPDDESERSDAEKLRFYTKNAANRERFADEIQRLKNTDEELARIYHQQIGKGRARSLGREFRDLGLEEAYVAIYDGQVVATAPTESALQETLSEIMPDGVKDHPYVYHYDP